MMIYPMFALASDAAVKRVAMLISVMVVSVVAIGWYRILSDVLSEGASVAALPCAIFLGSSCVFLARAIAVERVRPPQHAAGVSGWGHTITYVLLLLFVSATGSLSGALHYGGAKALVAENIDELERRINEFTVESSSYLATPAFTRKQAEVDRLWTLFELELKNPSNCGEGLATRRALDQLRKELPALPIILRDGRYCAEAQIDLLLMKYRSMIDALMEHTEEFRSDRVAEKKDFGGQLKSFARQSEQALAQARLDLLSSAADIDEARGRIKAVAAQMQVYVERAQFLSGSAVRHADELEELRPLHSSWPLLGQLWSRASQTMASIYGLSVLGIDALLILAWIRCLQALRPHAAPVKRESSDARPTFLWVNP